MADGLWEIAKPLIPPSRVRPQGGGTQDTPDETLFATPLGHRADHATSWLSGYRRLSPRYERNPRNYLAFLGLAAALCCYKRLVRLTT